MGLFSELFGNPSNTQEDVYKDIRSRQQAYIEHWLEQLRRNQQPKPESDKPKAESQEQSKDWYTLIHANDYIEGECEVVSEQSKLLEGK